VITGDTGTNTRDYKKLGELYGLDIDWTGRIEKHEDVISLIKGAEMLLHPSLYEGFGLPPKEAIWAEVPAVVADTPVMRELHGDYITYINPVDPNSISHVLYNWVQKRKRSYDHRMAKKTIAKYAMLPQIERFEKQLLERTL
jgi:glycosyltransferase involved in cell wall biosynthesis